ncbi:MAG: RsmB/NOP family class I SAM-dependent RNA methyltransferase [Rhodobiaceae bacterium]|nr:RsmB/NOP family class I SAM-dependent RNA methyltransferase [Rhodobiaceae bacterium]
MRISAQVSSSIEILYQVIDRYQPVPIAIREWARNNRYAGSSDRNAINNIVNATLRKKNSSAMLMKDDSPRSLCIGMFRLLWGKSVGEISDIFNGEIHSPDILTEDELLLIKDVVALEDAPSWVRGDYPEWLDGEFQKTFGEDTLEQAVALSSRPSLDIRVNTLKTKRDRVLKELNKFNPEITKYSVKGIRIKQKEGLDRSVKVENSKFFIKGYFEVQNEGSQIVSLLSGAKPGMQVLDYCCGAGGKTAVFSTLMENKGQVYSHDISEARVKPIYERLKRLGIRNSQIRIGKDSLEDLTSHCDIVFIDSPCSGSGTWRRKPDTKWRFNKNTLDRIIETQENILKEASEYVAKDGLLIYVTCSVLDSENSKQIEKFLSVNKNFNLLSWKDIWSKNIGGELPISANKSDKTLLLTPKNHETDGFFIAIMQKTI